jgi:hypothetical protein
LTGKSRAKTQRREKQNYPRPIAFLTFAPLREKTLLASDALLLYPFPMFEMIAPQLTTAAGKLTHLRRFL